MAYNLKYFTEFSNMPFPSLGLASEKMRINFYFDGFEGTATELKVTVTGVQHSYVDNSDEFIPIRARTLKIVMVAEEGGAELEDFYTTSDDDCIVQLEKLSGSSHVEYYFIGWLSAFDAREPYAPKPYTFEVNAYCGLSSMKDFPFEGTGLMTFNEAIRLCLAKARLGGNYIVNIKSRIDGDTGDPTKLYTFYADALKGLTCYEALEKILDAFVADIVQKNGVWMIRGVAEQSTDASTHFYYNFFGTIIGSEVTLSDNYALNVGRAHGLRNIYGAITRKRAALSYLEIEYDLGNTRNLLLNGDFAQVSEILLLNPFASWTAYNLSAPDFEALEPGLKMKGRTPIVATTGQWWALNPFAPLLSDRQYFESDIIDIEGADSVTFSGKFTPFEVDFARFEVFIIDPDNSNYVLWLTNDGTWSETRSVIMFDYKATVVRFFGDTPPDPPSYPFEIKSETIPNRREVTSGTSERPYVNIRYKDLYVRVYKGSYNNRTVQVASPTGPYVIYEDLVISYEPRNSDRFKLKYGFKNANYVRKNAKKITTIFGGFSVELTEGAGRAREAYLDSYSGVIRDADGEPLVDEWVKPNSGTAVTDFVRLNGLSRLRLEANSAMIWEGDLVGARVEPYDILVFDQIGGRRFKITSYNYDEINRVATVSARELLTDDFDFVEELEGEEGDTTGASIPKLSAGITEPALSIQERVTNMLNARFSKLVTVTQTIDTTLRPQFIQIISDGGEAKARKSVDAIDAVIINTTAAGGGAQAILPGMVIGSFSGLTPGVTYAYVASTDTIVEYDEDNPEHLLIGKAISATEVIFTGSGLQPKPRQDTPVEGELWCDIGASPDDDSVFVTGELWCDIGEDTEEPPTFDVLTITDLEGPASSFSLTYSEVTDSNRRPIFSFYGRLNGDIVPNGEFIQWSINGATWYDCGKFAGGKHYTIYPDTLPLVLDFDTTYSLRIRYTSNTALVSNLVNATTAVEPEAATDDDYLTIWNFDGFSRIQENGRYNDAYEHGVRCLAPYDFFHPSFFNRTSGVYNLEELEWQIETLHEKGYKLLIHGRPTYAQPTAYDFDQSVRVHRRSGGGWTTITYSYRSTYHLGDAEWERDRNNAILGVNSNFDTKGSISYANATAVGRYLELMARIAHLVNTGTCPDGTPYADVVVGISLIDGGLNETGFNTQAFDPYTDGFYSDSTMAALRTYMQTKYGNIYALNSAWERNYGSFAEINRGNVPKPNEGLDVNYNENQALRDIFDFRINHHSEFYQKVADAIHAPSTIVGGLSASTDIKFFAYVTENFTSGQGRTWGVLAMRKMYAPFDALLSSTSSGGSPNYPTGSLSGGRTVHRDYAVRAALMRCILGNGNFGQEQDGDPVEVNHGNSTSFEITKQYGGKYSVVALQVATDGEDPSHSWNRNVRSADGLTRTYRNDLKWMYETKMRGVTPPALPSLASTLTYTDKDALAAPHNPNDILNTWMNAAQPNAYGIVNSLVGLDNTYTLGDVSLVIDGGSIEFTSVSVGGGSSKQILFWATVNGKTINNGLAFDWTTNGTNWFQGGKFPGGKLTTNVTSAGYLTSGMTVSLQIRLTGATSVLSNIITGITIP